DFELSNNVSVYAETSVRLNDDLPGAAETIEVVDVVATQVSLQGVENVAERHAHGLGLGPVDVDVELGRPGAEAVEQADQTGLLVALRGQVVRAGLQRVEVDVAGGFDHQFEAAGVAKAPYRRRPKDQDASLRNVPLHALPENSRDGLAVQRGLPTFVERLEDDEHGAVVRAVGVEHERCPRDGHRVGNSRCIESYPFD